MSIRRRIVRPRGEGSREEAQRPRDHDGRPFADTKEHIGGLYLVECEKAEALAYAADIPAAVSGSVEVRPVGVPHRPVDFGARRSS